MGMRQETIERLTRTYLKSGGHRCPFPDCGSNDLVAGETDTQDDFIFRNVTCQGCGREWTDEYLLSGVTFEEGTKLRQGKKQTLGM